MSKAVKTLFGGEKTTTEVNNSMPPWFQDTAKWNNSALQGALQGQDSSNKQYQSTPYPTLSNPYSGFSEKYGLEGMMKSDEGKQYLNTYTKPAETSVKNAFAANGLYGSQGSGMMDSAVSNAVSTAQNNAVSAWNNDLIGKTSEQQWANQNATDAWQATQQQQQYKDALSQQYIQNLLSLYGITIPTYNQSNVISQKSSGGGLGKLASGLGAAIGGGLFSSRSFKKEIRKAPSVLDRLRDLDVKTWEYKPEYKGLMDADGTYGGRHIGPIAEEWAAIFGGSGKMIPTQEAFGVSLKAIQELTKKVDRLEGLMRG